MQEQQRIGCDVLAQINHACRNARPQGGMRGRATRRNGKERGGKKTPIKNLERRTR